MFCSEITHIGNAIQIEVLIIYLGIHVRMCIYIYMSLFMHVCVYAYVRTTKEKEAMNLRERKDGCIGGLGERTGNGEMR